jgi:DNA repair exonuclease SbcCD ATPase subunit/DNA repair exonuclease SbcCD nuclease subunit
MKFLLTADLQLRNFSEFSSLTVEGYDARLLNLLSGLTEIIEANLPLDGVVIAGDIFDNKASLETDLLDLTHRTFQLWSEKTEVLLVKGNHDTAFLSANIHALTQFSKYCTVIEEPTVHKELAFAPWRPTVAAIEEDIASLVGKSKTLVGHWTVAGASTGSMTLENGVAPDFKPLLSFDKIILGDIHRPQTLGKNITYLGSPAQNNFGEEGNENYVWILDTTAETLERLPTAFPQFKTCETFTDAEVARKEGYYVRLRAKSREELSKANDAGLRAEQDFQESVAEADSVRALVSTLEESVQAYAIANNREDVMELGLEFLRNSIGGRSVPNALLRFERLHAENFLSYEKLDIDFSTGFHNPWSSGGPGCYWQPQGLVLVHGEVVADQSYDSNGAGKTALYEAIYYGLYGTTLRYGIRKDATIREGQTRNLVELEVNLMQKGETTGIKIRRPRPGVVNLFLKNPSVLDSQGFPQNPKEEWSDVTNSDARLTQEAINKLVGDPEFFLRLTLLALHYHPSFLRLSDPEKKKFIDQFSGLDNFANARDAVSNRLSTLELDERRLEVEKTRYSERETVLQRLLESGKSELADFLKREEEAATARAEEIAELEKKLSELQLPVLPDLPTTFDKPKKPAEPKIPDLAPIKRSIEEVEALLSEARPQLTEIREAHVALINPLSNECVVLRRKIADLESSTKSTECPTCKRPFENAEEFNTHIQNEITKFIKLQKIADQKFEERRKASVSETSEIETVVTQLEAQLREDRAAIDSSNSLLFQYEKELQTYEREVARAEIAFKDRIAQLTKQYDAKKSQFALQQQRLSGNIENLKAIKPGNPDGITTRISELEKELQELAENTISFSVREDDLRKKKADLQFWLVGFGNRGCKSLLYTSLIDKLNDELRKICNTISGGALLLRLLPYAENSKGDQIERITLEATNYLGALTFEGDSLGEQNRIDIAVSLALRRVLRAFSGYSASFLFVDEPWLGLDKSGKMAIYSLLEEEAKDCLILATDQDKSSKGFTSAKVWVVRKENKISVLNVE